MPAVLSAPPRPKVYTKQCTSRSQAGCTLLLLHARLCIHTHSHTATRVCARRHVASFQLPFAAFDYILLRNQHSVLSEFATGTRLVALMATVLERGYISFMTRGNGTPHTCFMTAQLPAAQLLASKCFASEGARVHVTPRRRNISAHPVMVGRAERLVE